MKVWYIKDGKGQLWNGYGFTPNRKDAVPFYCLHCAGSVLRKLKKSNVKYPTPLSFEERALTRAEETTLVEKLISVLPR